jgi:hypothetical protein
MGLDLGCALASLQFNVANSANRFPAGKSAQPHRSR